MIDSRQLSDGKYMALDVNVLYDDTNIYLAK
jgi:hypothetical protein